jgi:16S rRNA (adenine1518-N6/adenine1519-N6)-dimethyltransferase
LREAGITANKALGQHFLTDESAVSRIVAGAALTAADTVIEVGPGLGVLTRRLVEVAGRVIAVELDGRLAQKLRETLAAQYANLTVVQADILKSDPAELLKASGSEQDSDARAYSVVGNLPYNIGAAIVRHFLEAEPQPRAMTVMLQREVADAICAEPGEMSLLGVSVQIYARPRRLLTLPPRAFYPPPKVTSSVIRLEVLSEPLVPREQRERFFAVLKAGFSAPRKQLANSLAQGLRREASEARAGVLSAGIDPSLRPQALAVDDWLKLASVFEGLK